MVSSLLSALKCIASLRCVAYTSHSSGDGFCMAGLAHAAFSSLLLLLLRSGRSLLDRRVDMIVFFFFQSSLVHYNEWLCDL